MSWIKWDILTVWIQSTWSERAIRQRLSTNIGSPEGYTQTNKWHCILCAYACIHVCMYAWMHLPTHLSLHVFCVDGHTDAARCYVYYIQKHLHKWRAWDFALANIGTRQQGRPHVKIQSGGNMQRKRHGSCCSMYHWKKSCIKCSTHWCIYSPVRISTGWMQSWFDELEHRQKAIGVESQGVVDWLCPCTFSRSGFLSNSHSWHQNVLAFKASKVLGQRSTLTVPEPCIKAESPSTKPV